MAEGQQPWEIRFERQLEKLLLRLSKEHFRLITMTILALADDPRPPESEKLVGPYNLYQIKVVGWDIYYEIEDDKRLALIIGLNPIRPPKIDRGETSELEDQATPPAIAEKSVVIRLRIGDSKREVEAMLNNVIHLGRSDVNEDFVPDIDLTADDGLGNGVSRQHARILKRKGVVVVEDLGSTNGTFIDGKRLAPYLPEVLGQDSELRLGRLRIEIDISG